MSGNDNSFFNILPAISLHHGRNIQSSLKGKNAFIFYQNKEDGKLDRGHRSIKGGWETLSFADKKPD